MTKRSVIRKTPEYTPQYIVDIQHQLQKMLQKTRFVCVSDTHGYTPSEAGFKLPRGDVLVHAGDLTNQGSKSELQRTIDWISKADYEVKIIVGGNHDVTLDPSFYAQHGTRFHNQHLEDPQKCIEVVTESPDPSIVYLCHEPAVIRLTRPEGPNTVFKVFGSPYSPSSSSGSSSKWAFGYETTADDDDAAVLWDQIPLDTDLVVSHTPPHSHCDRRMTGGPVGCQRLRQVLHRVRPKLAVCGHVHESRGYERVRWSSSSTSASGETETEGQVIIEEEAVERGVLPQPGSKKQSLVDLTGKTTRRLDNEWSSSDRDWTMGVSSCTNSTITRTGNPQMTTTGQEGHDNGGHAIRARRREETCIINAAIMATSWPHRGGKRFNTPIVVDLECPVWNNYRRK